MFCSLQIFIIVICIFVFLQAAEVAPEPDVAETAEEAKTDNESKEEKTPDTPVTEPITNGSTTPESPKDESPVAEEPAAPSPTIDRPEPQPETQPEQLPINGLSLEEPAKEIVKEEKNDESKEEPTAVATEIVPEIPAIKEVCVEQMPLIDSTPPPLPANPPPSSVASFAATTMAPESTNASLANTADNAIPPQTCDPIANANDKKDDLPPPFENELTNTLTISNELPSPVKEDTEEVSVPIAEIEAVSETEKPLDSELPLEETPEVEKVKTDSIIVEESSAIVKEEIENTEISENTDIEITALPSEDLEILEDKNDISNTSEDLPSPPSPICDDADVTSSDNIIVEENVDNTQVTINETREIVVVSNHISDTEKTSAPENEVDSIISEQNVKAKSKDSLGDLIETVECNGNIEVAKETSEIMAPIDSKEMTNIEAGRTGRSPEPSPPSPPSPPEPTEGASNDSASLSPPPSEPEPQVNTDRTLLICSGISSVM